MDREASLSAVRIELQQPHITPQRLHELAAEFPELHTIIVQHPEVYPDLREWILQQLSSQDNGQTELVELPSTPIPEQPSHILENVAAELLYPQPLPSDNPKVLNQSPLTEEPARDLSELSEPDTIQPANISPQRGASSASQMSPNVSRSAKVKAFGVGLVIGLLVGGALSAVLILWVLPGLFGSFLG